MSGPVSEQFPRASAYSTEWLASAASGGANPLELTEWVTSAMELRPGMRVLDLGCGRAASSVFLRREFGAEVWAVDLWFDPSENLQRVRDAGVGDGVFPIHADARELPFAAGFFDAIISIDSFVYYGTDDLYLNDIARYVRPGGQVGIAGSGLVHEIDGPVPEHLAAWWEPAMWCLHSPAWWRHHWQRTGIVEVDVADTMPDGHQRWLDWQRIVAPDNSVEITALQSDGGRTLGYVRVTGRRTDVELDPPLRSITTTYRPVPLLRNDLERASDS